MSILYHIYYFMFHPTGFVPDWHSLMFRAMVFSVIMIIICLFVFYFWKYNRNALMKVIWWLFGISSLFFFMLGLRVAHTASDEIVAGHYRMWFIINTLCSGMILEYICFVISSFILYKHPKRYFARSILPVKKWR